MIQLSINHYNLLILLNVYLAILIHICSISMLDIGFFSTYNDNIFEKKGVFVHMMNSTYITLASNWSIDSFLQNLSETLKLWGGYLFVVIGVVLVIVAIWKTATGLMSHGQKQVSWGMVFIMFVLGGALIAANGFDWVENIAIGGKDTIDALGK